MHLRTLIYKKKYFSRYFVFSDTVSVITSIFSCMSIKLILNRFYALKGKGIQVLVHQLRCLQKAEMIEITASELTELFLSQPCTTDTEI